VERERKKTLNYVEEGPVRAPFMRHPSVADTPTLRKIDFIPEGKYIYICDLHIPYHDDEMLEMVLKEEAVGVIIGGDVFDAEKFSPFPSRKKVSFIDEYNIALDIVKALADRFLMIIIIPGNHDRRLKKLFYSTAELMDMVEFFNPDPLYLLAKGIRMMDGFEISKPLYNNVLYYDNALLFGNVIFDHPDNYLSTPGGTVRKVIRHFVAKTHEHFDYVIIGHTHKTAEIQELGKIGIEGGCMCRPLPHLFGQGKRSDGDVCNMYMVLHFENGELARYEKIMKRRRASTWKV